MPETKTVIITGAGRGIGAAVARELHTRGYYVGLMSPSRNATNLARELGGMGVEGSVTEPADLKRLVDTMMQHSGRIDAVVNHTGHPPRGELLDVPDEDWHKGLNLLFMNVVRLARLVTPIMERQRTGAIVNISTFAAFEPSLRLPVSSCNRAALSAFTKLYADRYAEAGIRMNAVLPGYIDSLNHDESTRQSIPMKRIGRVKEMAETVAFLLSDAAGYITGQSIKVDGGLTRHV